MGIECLDQLGEVGERAGQPIDLVDDDHVDPSRLHIDEQLLERRPIQRAAGEAAVVVTIPNQSPALMRLALDVGLARLPLGVEGIEVLFEPLVGRDPRIDRATETALGRLIPMATLHATRHSRYRRRSHFCSFGDPCPHRLRKSFPDEGQRSGGRSRWFRSSLWRSGTGCRRSDRSKRSRPPGS